MLGFFFNKRYRNRRIDVCNRVQEGKDKMQLFFKNIKKYWKYAIYAAKADLKAEVANSYLNWLWWLIEPFCSMVIYTVVFGVVFKSSETYFPIFVFVGITMWTFFSRCISSSVNIIRDNQEIISKVYIPKYVLLFERMLVLAFKMMICLGLIAVMMIQFRVKISINLIYLLPVFLVFFIFTFACGTYVLHFGVYINDLSNVIGIVLDLLFYVTGIFYNVQKSFPEPFGEWLQRINPIAYMISCARKALIYCETPSIMVIGVWLLVSLILAVGGIMLIHKNENNYVRII